MLKMSFYNGTFKKDVLKDFISKTEKEIRYTYGYAWKNPTTNKKLISKAEALRIVTEESMIDADETHDTLYLNAYSGNDMF